MLGYLAQKGNDETSAKTFGYKDSIARMFWNKTYVEQMLKVDLSPMLVPTRYICSDNDMKHNEKIQEASKAADKMMAQTSIESALLKDIMSDEEKNNVSVTQSGGKTFIGPYKVGLSGGCKVGNITINKSEKADGITYDMANIENVESIVDSKAFYIVINKSLAEIKEITVTSKDAIVSSKARLLLVSGGASQNFIIYRGSEKKEKLSINLTVPKYGSLKIKKVDSDDKTKVIEGIGFKVYSEAKQNWVTVENGKVNFKSFDNATEFKTKKDGYTDEIEKLPLGKYKIYETSIPKSLQDIYQIEETITLTKIGGLSYTRTAKFIKDVEIKSSSAVEIVATNKKAFSSLQIKKVDKTTNKVLQGVGFKIYSKSKQGWLKVDSNNNVVDYVDFTKATQFVTNTNGLTPQIHRVPLGHYMIVETALGPYNSIYKLGTFRFNGGNITGNIIYEDFEVKANKLGVVTATGYNKQEYISLSGYVWQDIVGNYDNKTEMQANGIYDTPDYKVNGVTVVLKDKQGNIVKNGDGNECIAVTKEINGKNGYYRFEKIEIDQIENYYVEFTYDGLTYQSVIPQINKDEGSKAQENENSRDEFNKMFETITGKGQTINGHELNYETTTTNGITQVTLTNARKISSKVEKQENNPNSENVINISSMGDFTINSTTTEAKYSIKAEYDKLKEKFKAENKLVTEIENINLGLYERGQTDISLVKDVYSSKLSINGFNHVYEYGKYFNYIDEPRQESDFNVAIEWKNQRTGTYTGPIYRSDLNYTNDDKSKELKVSITYAIDIRNENINTDRTVKVNSIVDYFDAKYEKTGIKVGTTIDKTTGEVNGDLVVSEVQNVNSKYNKITIDTSKLGEIAATGENHKTIYVKFDLSKAQIAEILKGEGAKAPLDNVTEIASYSTIQNGKPYAAIDTDSIPNNAQIDKQDTYEDDTDKAPSFVLHLEDDRTLSGTVFVDKAETYGRGNVREGNGQYDEGEQVIAGVKVVMTEVNKDGTPKTNAIVIDKDKDGNEILTNEKGEFTITGYIPSYYTISYEWGNAQGYDVTEYKGIVCKELSRFEKLDWYKTEDPRYSDAMDSYEIREKIDAGEDIKSMTSTTPVFGVGIDANGATEIDITTVSDGDKFVRQESKYIDFGIIERAKQSLEISKTVDTLKITDASGRVLVDAKVNSEGKLEGQISGVTGGPSLGFIKAEIDNEAIQGSTAQIGYKITVTNNGELDYADKDFYLYGTIPANDENIIKLKATNIYDYLDNDMKLDNNTTESNSWTQLVTSEVEKEETPTLIEEYFMSSVKSEKQEDGTVVVKGLEEVQSETVKKLLQEWYNSINTSETTTITNKLTQIRTLKLDERKVLKLEGTAISPKDEPLVYNLYSTSLLSSSDEIRLDNETEITDVEIYKNNNNKLEKVPGREVDVKTSKLYDKAEWVTVTPPTGDNKDYTMIIIISISAIVILATGIVFIKKKVLK